MDILPKGLLATLHEIRVVDDLPVEVRMLHGYAGIYHSNFHAFARGPAVRHVGPNSLGAVLEHGVLIVMSYTEPLKALVRLCRFDPRIGGEMFNNFVDGTAWRNLEHDALDAERRQRECPNPSQVV
jgi:hypothetical protein